MLARWNVEAEAWEDMPCVECGGESKPNLCHACWPDGGKLHHHGLVHSARDDGRGPLTPYCRHCHHLHIEEWQGLRELRKMRELGNN